MRVGGLGLLQLRWVLSFGEAVLGAGRRAGLAGRRRAGAEWVSEVKQ